MKAYTENDMNIIISALKNDANYSNNKAWSDGWNEAIFALEEILNFNDPVEYIENFCKKVKPENKLTKIADFYGLELQRVKAMEELAELIQELARSQLGKDRLKNLTFEIADVVIMLEQLRYLYCITDEEIEKSMQYKIERQLKRINESGNQ